MSYADTLPGPQRERYAAAVTAAGRLLAEALADQAEVIRVHGARAAAEAACRPGGLPAQEIEAAYQRMTGTAPEAGKAA